MDENLINRFKTSFIHRLPSGLTLLPIVIGILGVLLIVIGNTKSAEFNKTEKVKMTFTEPVVSVSQHKDSDGDISYIMRVEYVYKGENRVYSFTNSKKYNVGDTVTFTKYFTPDGTEIENKGSSMTAGGSICIGMSVLLTILLIIDIRVFNSERVLSHRSNTKEINKTGENQ